MQGAPMGLWRCCVVCSHCCVSPVLCCVSYCVFPLRCCVSHCCPVSPRGPTAVLCSPRVPLLLRPSPFPTQGAATVSCVAPTAFCLVMQTWETRERHKLGSLENFCCLNPLCKQLLEVQVCRTSVLTPALSARC